MIWSINRKIRVSFFVAWSGLFLLGAFLFAEQDYCCFCDLKQVNKQLIHETEHIVTVYCSKPATKGHLLIIPKRHVERFQDLTAQEFLLVQQEVNHFSKVFKEKYQLSDFLLIQKNGKNAGQTVPHLHFHVIPSPENFDQTMYNSLCYRNTIPDDELKERIQELKD